MRRFRLLAITVVVATFVSILAGAAPASAQQLVNASGEGGGGGLAFVLMVVMVVGIAGSLFFMDHVRRNRLPDDEE